MSHTPKFATKSNASWSPQMDKALVRYRKEQKMAWITVAKLMNRTKSSVQTRYSQIKLGKITSHNPRGIKPGTTVRSALAANSNPFTPLRQKLERLENEFNVLQPILANIK